MDSNPLFMPVRLTVVPNIFEWLLQIGNKIRPIIEKSVVSYMFFKKSLQLVTFNQIPYGEQTHRNRQIGVRERERETESSYIILFAVRLLISYVKVFRLLGWRLPVLE